MFWFIRLINLLPQGNAERPRCLVGPEFRMLCGLNFSGHLHGEKRQPVGFWDVKEKCLQGEVKTRL